MKSVSSVKQPLKIDLKINGKLGGMAEWQIKRISLLIPVPVFLQATSKYHVRHLMVSLASMSSIKYNLMFISSEIQ